MNIWIANSNYMKKNFDGFYEKVTSKEYNCPELHLEPVHDGNYLLKKDTVSCYLHSTFDIEREMAELLKDSSGPDQIFIIFGMGMGHCVDYIRKHKIKYRQILVLEPYNNIFREVLKQRTLYDLLALKNLSLTLFKEPRDVIGQIIGQVMTSNRVKVISHIAYRTIYADMFEEISRLFSNEKLALQVGAATLNYFLLEWTRNQIKSIGKKSTDASTFYNRFNNVPAIVVSAGPSLEKRLEELKSVGDKALIIAPGTGAKICHNRGVKAHMALAMDAQAATAELVRDSSIDILIGSYRLHEEVDRAFHNRLFRFIISNDNIAQYYYEYLGLPIEIISDFSSVSSSSVHYAAKLGCSPIVLIGQDLCFYDNRFHADEEKDSLEPEVRNNWFKEVDINGNEVYTDQGFLAIRHDMEVIALQYKDHIMMINASEAGLGVPGIANMKFSEVIKQYIESNDKDVSCLIEEAINEASVDIFEQADVLGFYQHIIEECEKMDALNTGKAEDLKKLYALIQKDTKQNRLETQMEIIEEKNREMMADKFYVNVVYQPISRFLLYYMAASLYYAENDERDPASFLYYETQVVEMTGRYIAIIKSVVNEEIALVNIAREALGAIGEMS